MFNKIKTKRKLKKGKFLTIILAMINKNFKLIIRSKSSALIVLLGPLLITLLVGTAFNTTALYDLKIGTYSGEYSGLTESLLTSLDEKDFRVIKLNSKEECMQSLKIGEIHTCAVFPDNLEIGTKEPIMFYVDESRMNLVWIIIETISKQVSTKSSELSLELTTVVLNTLEDTNKKISDKVNVIENAATENQETTSQVSELKSSLNGLDVTFLANDLQLIEVRKKLNNIIEDNNLTASLFDGLRASIDFSINKSESIEDKFTNASMKISETTTNLDSVSSKLSTQQKNIGAIKSTLSSIKESVDSIEVKDADTIVTPIKTSVETLTEESTHLNFLFPTLVILVVMFISLLLSSTLIIREKESPAFFRNFITPTSDAMFILGDYLTNISILAIQLIVIFIVAAFFFKEELWLVLSNSSLLLFIIASVFIMAGMLIGYIFKTEETSTLGAISLGSILLFFSNTILPIESLPKAVQEFIVFNPFVIAESVLKKLMLFNTELSVVAQNIGVLAIFFLILTVCVYGARKISKRFT